MQQDDTTRRAPTLKSHTELSTFVPAYPQKRELARVEMSAPIIDLLPQTANTHQSRQDDSAVTNAKATLLVAAAYVAAAAMITGGLLLLAWMFRALGDAWATYTYTALVVWGVCTVVALWGNRKQGLHHSPTGLAHHEVDSRERIAIHAIDTHAELLLKRWEMDRDGE